MEKDSGYQSNARLFSDKAQHQKERKSFVLKNALRLLIGLGMVAIFFWILKAYFPAIISRLFERFSAFEVIFFFFVSESILGLLPPDLFIAWTADLSRPWVYLVLLAFASYLGGIISYFLGMKVGVWSGLQAWVYRRYEKYFDMIYKWGGWVIVVATLFPLPFSPVSMVAGVVKYPLKRYAAFALFRILRFFLYGSVIYRILLV